MCGAAKERNGKPDVTNGPGVLIDPPAELPDPYGWMRDESREKTEVLEHLKAENKYTEELTAHLDPLRKTLYDEMIGFIQETDYTTPMKKGEYVYYTRTHEGKSYKMHYRAPLASLPTDRPITWDGKASTPILDGEVLLLDENALAEGHKYCSVGTCSPSPSGNLLVYTVDNTGGETYGIFVKDISTGEIVDSLKGEIDSYTVWGAGDDKLFYCKMDEAHRPYQVYVHELGSGGEDEKLFQEDDELFWLGIR